MVMNCMFYGDISSGGNISPVYGGNHTNNVQKFTEYNYYLYSNERNENGERKVKIELFFCLLPDFLLQKALKNHYFMVFLQSERVLKYL